MLREDLLSSQFPEGVPCGLRLDVFEADSPPSGKAYTLSWGHESSIDIRYCTIFLEASQENDKAIAEVVSALIGVYLG